MCLQYAYDFWSNFMISRLISIDFPVDLSLFPLISGESVRDFFRFGPLGSHQGLTSVFLELITMIELEAYRPRK